jgi:hypothetical protein
MLYPDVTPPVFLLALAASLFSLTAAGTGPADSADRSDRAVVGDPSTSVPLAASSMQSHRMSLLGGRTLMVTIPPGWSFMTPAEARARTGGQLQIAQRTVGFIVHDTDPDDNVNVISLGDVSADLPNDTAARAALEGFARDYRTAIPRSMPGADVTSTRVLELAGGIAFEGEYQVPRDGTPMRQRSLMLVVAGGGVTITFTSTAAQFARIDHEAFQPITDSLRFE